MAKFQTLKSKKFIDFYESISTEIGDNEKLHPMLDCLWDALIITEITLIDNGYLKEDDKDGN